MRNIQLLLEYDGSQYHGWQRQNNVITIQQKVEEAIHKITHENNIIIGSSRTDSGVHATGQSGNFLTATKIPIDKIPRAINSHLPYNIRVYKAIQRPLEFHSRYNAIGKKYSYHILNNTFGSALEYHRVWHVPHNLDIDKMIKASEYFIGTHDFSAFKSKGSSVKTSVRTIYSAHLTSYPDRLVFEIEGNGFLYNMVRIIVGTLVEVGSGKLLYHKIPQIIESKDRNQSGATAPARGLYLEKVYYKNT